MKIIIKQIKYNNNIFFINNNEYSQFYVYFAQKTKKNMLFKTQTLLNINNIKLIQYNKQWELILQIKNQIPLNIYKMSSSLFIGFYYSNKKITNNIVLKIHMLPTQPLILIYSYLPKQIFTLNRYNISLMGVKPDYFFSQLLFNQYLTKIQTFNISIFFWLDLICH